MSNEARIQSACAFFMCVKNSLTKAQDLQCLLKFNYMKKTNFFILVTSFMFCSCITKTPVADLNMVSTRNINSNTEYELLSSYQGSTKKEVKSTFKEAKKNKKQMPKGSKKEKIVWNIEDAINRTIKTVPGGEYMMNCKIYLVKKGVKRLFACEGDVWGVKTGEFHGWKQGDKLTYKKFGKYLYGEFVGHKDFMNCLIKNTDGKIIEVKYTDIVKTEESK